MLIPSLGIGENFVQTSLSRRVNANSQLAARDAVQPTQAYQEG